MDTTTTQDTASAVPADEILKRQIIQQETRKAQLALQLLPCIVQRSEFWMKTITTQLPQLAEATPQRCMVVSAFSLLEDFEEVVKQVIESNVKVALEKIHA